MVLDTSLVSALLIAVVQGITEWLPVSSSGHLVLAEKILGYEGGLLFDVALHFGTLMAVFVYFGGDIVNILKDLITGKWESENSRAGLLLIVATFPAAIVGILFKSVFELSFNSLEIVALGFGVTALVLFIASLDLGRKTKSLERFSYREAFIIGIAQVFSILPGISRSGVTLAVGLLTGLNEKNALKFSFLMSIPVVFGANILVIGNQKLPPNLIWATLVSFIIGLIAIHILYKYVLTNRRNLKWFGFYALALALILIISLLFTRLF